MALLMGAGQLGLIFQKDANFVWATAKGNIAAYYLILNEVRAQMKSGNFLVKINLSSGEQKIFNLSLGYVQEDGEDISSCPIFTNMGAIQIPIEFE